jgi:hypothetical protein
MKKLIIYKIFGILLSLNSYAQAAKTNEPSYWISVGPSIRLEPSETGKERRFIDGEYYIDFTIETKYPGLFRIDIQSEQGPTQGAKLEIEWETRQIIWNCPPIIAPVQSYSFIRWDCAEKFGSKLIVRAKIKKFKCDPNAKSGERIFTQRVSVQRL